eukprot:TRINITY_DN1770_c0_g1_i3.p1 TRINITY_DN1770_c0_g1~~TRINITY_DN1770_c0_g1_i3.p1  ORF type:complete len:133 (-),score=21.62 TRINITY_DN1770_c0_g1_i3:113-511(-)
MSKKGAEFYLLHGWTMMAESCPQCSQPLYCDERRSKKIVCAACDMEVVRQSAEQANSRPTAVTTDHPLIPDPKTMDVLGSTVDTVLAKLEAAQQRLSACHISEFDEQKHLCKLIKLYLETLKALKKAQGYER